MGRRKPAMIIKEILHVLKEKPHSLRALESKINTNDRTIKEYTSLLSDLNLIKLSNETRGLRSVTIAQILPAGQAVK